MCNFTIKIKNKKYISRANNLNIFELKFDLANLISILIEFELNFDSGDSRTVRFVCNSTLDYGKKKRFEF